MRVGVLGGTFNPPHNGHIYVANEVRKTLKLDKIIFIPTNIPPHKNMPENSATTSQRLEMLEIMLKDYDWAIINDIEIKRGGASYTIDTLLKIKENKNYNEIFFIMGADMLMCFDTGWKEPEKICKLCTLVVMARQKHQKSIIYQKSKTLQNLYNAKIVVIDCDVMEISSTEIRKGLRNEKMLPKKINDYICKNRLYLS